jgi:hypothetical protein
MCLACVASSGHGIGSRAADSRSTASASVALAAAAATELEDWSPDDAERAVIVYRQLPRWSRRLFDALSAPRARKQLAADLRAKVLAPEDPFSLDDACRWAADFCAYVGRRCPVISVQGLDGQTWYRMNEMAARLFGQLATPAVQHAH